MKLRRHKPQEAELDITSFMNLMIILVPVLLMSMVFSHITVLELKLPDLASGDPQNKAEQLKLEVVIREDFIDVNHPAGVRLKRIPKKDEAHDMAYLSLVMQEVKRNIRELGEEKRDILVLSEPSTDYQTIVSVMDTVRSFKALVVTDVVDAELFPIISMGDAPVAVEAEQ